MRPPSFEEFMKLRKAGVESPDDLEELGFDVCPTPGCTCRELKVEYENSRLKGFSCAYGCKFSVKRNAFTGEIVCFNLDSFDRGRFDDPGSIQGMKFTTVGECFTDWY